MTTQSTRSGSSSSFVKCDIPAPTPAPAPAPAPAPESAPCRRSVDAVPIRAPDDILKILHRYVNWETAEDLNKAHLLYTTTSTSTWQDVDKFDIEKELEVLKDLYSAIKEQYYICIKEQYDLCWKPCDEEEIVDEAEFDIKYKELNLRLYNIGNILSPMKHFIRILESVIKNPNQLQELSAEYRDYSAVPSANGAPAFRGPEDILKLLHRHVDWVTVEDLDRARELYTMRWRANANFDFGKQLDVLRGLHSAMKEQYDNCMKQLKEEFGDDVDEDDIKYEELIWRMSSIEAILSPVKKFTRILESAATARSVSKVAEYKDYSGREDTKGEKRKRNFERGRVEEGLLNLVTHLGGGTGIDKIGTSRWDGIVNDLCALVQ